jgi:hypothetical protein
MVCMRLAVRIVGLHVGRTDVGTEREGQHGAMGVRLAYGMGVSTSVRTDTHRASPSRTPTAARAAMIKGKASRGVAS